MKLSLSYLPYDTINKSKWDDCINNSRNGLIYARSFYLDKMAASWDAIVLGNYEAVMPLPWKRKWRIKYLYQPAFIQQGGIFSANALDHDTINSFVEVLKEHFRFAEITLNYGNEAGKIQGFLAQQRTNFILNLQRPYDDLYANYHPSFTKSLRRIRKFNLVYKSSDDHKSIIRLYKKLYGQRLPYFTTADFRNFEKICDQLYREKKIHTRIAYNNDNKLLAAVILLSDNKRLYNIISCITDAGKKVEANYFLYDEIIHEFSATPFLLDLEGSDVMGIAAFYKKFNPENQPYPFIKINNLPPVVKLFKR